MRLSYHTRPVSQIRHSILIIRLQQAYQTGRRQCLFFLQTVNELPKHTSLPFLRQFLVSAVYALMPKSL